MKGVQADEVEKKFEEGTIMRKLTAVLMVLTFVMVGFSLDVLAQEAQEEERKWQFGLLGGYAGGPYDLDQARCGFAAMLDMRLFKCPLGNRVSGEWFISWNHAEDDMTVTDITGTPQKTTVKSETITINANLKYTLEMLEKVKPYVLGGLGIYIFGMDTSTRLCLGQVPISPELEARHMPTGWAQFEMGAQFGGGVDFQIIPLLSIGVDARYNVATRHNNNFPQVFSKIAFHF